MRLSLKQFFQLELLTLLLQTFIDDSLFILYNFDCVHKVFVESGSFVSGNDGGSVLLYYLFVLPFINYSGSGGIGLRFNIFLANLCSYLPAWRQILFFFTCLMPPIIQEGYYVNAKGTLRRQDYFVIFTLVLAEVAFLLMHLMARMHLHVKF